MQRSLGALDSYLARAIFSDHKNLDDDKVLTYAIGGNNSSIAQNTREDIWDGGGFYTYLTAASVLTLTSDSAQDAPAGTGVKQVFIEGLDADYNPIAEFVTLAGLTPVNTVFSYLRCFQAFITQSDNADPNTNMVGTLTVNAGATLQQLILPGQSISRNSSRTIPAGYQGVVTLGVASTVTDGIFTAGHFTAHFQVRREGNIFANAISLDVPSNTTIIVPFAPFLGRLPGKSDVKAVGESLSSTSGIKVEYTMMCIRDDYFSSLTASV